MHVPATRTADSPSETGCDAAGLGTFARARRFPVTATKVSIRCRRCSRFWFDLSGTPEHGLAKVSGYPELIYHVHESGEVESDYPPGSSSVRVTNLAGPNRADTIEIMGTVFPRKAYERFRVACHRRCGRRDQTFRTDTLSRVYRDAVEAGHTEAAL